MLEALLKRKYGGFVTSNLMNSNKEVLVNHYNRNDPFHQQEVMNHILDMKDKNGTSLFPTNFKIQDADWGMDFSGWLGPIDNPKDFLFIGAEPHIWKNYQVVYGFGTNEEEDIHATALKYANDKKDIWYSFLRTF